MSSQRRIRALVAKPGLDGHDRGAQIVARVLRDAGMEVIYTGIRQTAEMIAVAAVQEDVDCVGLSMLSGGHLEHTADVLAALAAAGAEDVAVIVGGIIPAEDIPEMQQLGVGAIFGPGATSTAIVEAVRNLCRPALSAATSDRCAQP